MRTNRMVDAAKTVIDRTKDKRPTSGVVYGIDGDRVDIRLDNSSAILRHIRVVGDINTIMTGDVIELQWGSDGRPVAIITDSESLAVTADNETIEHSDDGMRVKSGGIQRHHIGFVLPDERTFMDLLSQAGWKINPESGVIFNSNISLSPHGAISIGEGHNIIKMSSYGIPDDPNSPEDDTDYRMWVGHTYPYAAGFALTKYGDLIARKGTIGGWTIASDQLYSDAGNATLHAGARPYLGMGATLYGETGFWAGKDTDYVYKVSIGEAGGAMMLFDGSDLTLQDIDLKMYDGTVLTLWIQDDGDFAIGSDIDTVAGTSMRIFSNDQSYNSEAFTGGDILIGNHDGAHMLWNDSSGQLQFRDGTTTGWPVQVYIDTDGSLAAGSGNVNLNALGLFVLGHDGLIPDGFGFPLGSSYNVWDGSEAYVSLWGSHYNDYYSGHLYAVADSDTTPVAMDVSAINEAWTGNAGSYLILGAWEFVEPPYIFQSSKISIYSENVPGPSAGMISISALADVSVYCGEGFEVVFNYSAGNRDFRVVGETTDMIFADASEDMVQIKNRLELPETTAPGTGEPASGWGAVFVKTDGKVYFKNDGGTEYDLTVQGGSAEWSESGGFLTQATGSDIVQIQNWIELEELTTANLPTTGEPGTGFGAVYVKAATGKVYFKNDGGTEYDLTVTGGSGYWTQGTGVLYPTAGEDIEFQATAEISTTSGDLDLNPSGNVTIPGDSKYLYLGADDDLGIMHSGSHAYLINTTGSTVFDTASGTYTLDYTADDSTRLYLRSQRKVTWGTVGAIHFQGYDDADNYTTYASLLGVSSVIANGSEDGRLYTQLMDNGTVRNVVILSGGDGVVSNSTYSNVQSGNVGIHYMYGKNDAAAAHIYAYHYGYAFDDTEDSEDGVYGIGTVAAGTVGPRVLFSLGSAAFQEATAISTTAGDLTLSPADQLYITTDTGIGIAAPEGKLDVRGTTTDTPGANSILVMGTDNPYWSFRATATALADLVIDRYYSAAYYEALRIVRATGQLVIAAGGLDVTGNITVTGTVDGKDVAGHVDDSTIHFTTPVEDTAYGTGWDSDTTHAPSQNAVFDKIDAMDTLISANTTTAEVESIIDAELVDGQSIDLAIDSLIATHTTDDDAHHAKYTDAEVETVITAELVDGQSIDNAIDALISTHSSASDPHTGYFLADGSRDLAGNLNFDSQRSITTTTGNIVLQPSGKVGILTELAFTGGYEISTDGTDLVIDLTNSSSMKIYGGLIVNDNAHSAGDFRVEGTSVDTILSDSDANMVQFKNWIELVELGTGSLPATGEPGTGWGAVYVKASDGKVYFKNDGGTEYDLTSTSSYGDSDVEDVITAELVDGQSIDLAIDSLILTHKNIASAHHTRYADSEVESVITAEIVDGQSIDNAIDALILTHKNISSAHHSRYADSEVESVITAELVDGQSIDNAIDSLISTHTSDDDAHHAKYTDAEVETVITAEIVDGQSIDNAIDALISTHSSASDPHTAYFKLAGETTDAKLYSSADLIVYSDAGTTEKARIDGALGHITTAGGLWAASLTRTAGNLTISAAGGKVIISAAGDIDMNPTSNVDITGNIVISGTVDSIDVYTDVTANTTHSGSDGSDHSKVTANETAIALRALIDAPTFTTSVTIPETHQTSDPDKFLCTVSGVIKYRTGAEVLADIGAAAGYWTQATGVLYPAGDEDIEFQAATTIGTTTGNLTLDPTTSVVFTVGGEVGVWNGKNVTWYSDGGTTVTAELIGSSGALSLTSNLTIYSGGDLMMYSDAGSTLKFSVDGATGNIDTAGSIGFDTAGSISTGTGDLQIQPAGDVIINSLTEITGGIHSDGDLEFIGAQAITTTAGDLTLQPSGNVQVYDAAGQCDLYVDSYTDSAYIHIRGGTDDLGGAQASIRFYTGTTYTWQMAGSSTGHWSLFDSAGAQTVISAIASGSLTLNPTTTLEVTPNANFAAGVDVTGITTLDGAVTINNTGADVDFRAASDNNANMFFIDGGADFVGIGTATQVNNEVLIIQDEYTGGDVTKFTAVKLRNNTASDGAVSQWYTTDYDGSSWIGGISWNTYMDPSGPSWTRENTSIGGAIIQVQNTSTSGEIHIYGVDEAGAFVQFMRSYAMDAGQNETVFNEGSVDVDFRVESDDNAHMLFVDAGNDQVIIGANTNVAGGVFEVVAEEIQGNQMSLFGYHTTDNAYPGMTTYGARGTRAAPTQTQSGDWLMNFGGRGRESTNPDWTTTRALIYVEALDNFTSTVAGAKMVFQTSKSGQYDRNIALSLGDEIVINEDGLDTDFRVEGANYVHSLFHQASTDQWIFGGNTAPDSSYAVLFEGQASTGPEGLYHTGLEMGSGSAGFSNLNLQWFYYETGAWFAEFSVLGHNIFWDESADTWAQSDATHAGARIQMFNKTGTGEDSVSLELIYVEAGAPTAHKWWMRMVGGTDVAQPTVYINPDDADMDFIVKDDSGGLAIEVDAAVEVTKLYGLQVKGAGTSFPTSPSPVTNDVFYRTDLGWLCYYDGTRWLTTTEFAMAFTSIDNAPTGASVEHSLRLDYAPYVTRIAVESFVSGTNDGSNYWTFVIRGSDEASTSHSTIHTYNTSTHTGSTWTSEEGVPGTSQTPANKHWIGMTYAKSNAPGNLYADLTAYYRLIVT